MSDDYERSVTPLPEMLNTPATVGFVLEQVASDLRKHEAIDADSHRDIWKGVTKMDIKVVDQEKRVERLYGGLAILALLIVVLLPVTYYAIKGVIVEELDKRFPAEVAARSIRTPRVSKVSTDTDVSRGVPWSPVRNAQASDK